MVTVSTLASHRANQGRHVCQTPWVLQVIAFAQSSSALSTSRKKSKALNEGKKEVFQEAKGEGFDLKVIKEIICLRKQDKDERDEHESLLDLYLSAMEAPETERSKAA